MANISKNCFGCQITKKEDTTTTFNLVKEFDIGNLFQNKSKELTFGRKFLSASTKKEQLLSRMDVFGQKINAFKKNNTFGLSEGQLNRLEVYLAC